MKELAYIDGSFIELTDYAIQLEDRGYQMGDGVYETIRVYDGTCFAVKRHLASYRRSMRELLIPITDTDEELYRLFNEMIEKSGMQNGLIYFQLTRGTAPRRYEFPQPSLPHLNVILRDTPVRSDWQENGIRAALIEDIRWLRCDIRSLNLLGNILAAEQAKRLGAAAALLYRREKDFITEGLDRSFFLIKDGVLWTHPADNFIRSGVTRSLIKEKLAPRLDLTLVEKKFSREFLFKAEEAFFADTENEIVPVTMIDRTPIGDGRPGKTTQSLLAALHTLIQEGVDQDEDE